MINLATIFGGNSITILSEKPEDIKNPCDIIALLWHHKYIFSKHHAIVSNAYLNAQDSYLAVVVGDNVYYSGTIRVYIKKTKSLKDIKGEQNAQSWWNTTIIRK